MFIFRSSILLLIILLGCNRSNNSSGPVETPGTPGCIDVTACNYSVDATIDDGSCTYTNCTDSSCETDVCISISNIVQDKKSVDILMINTIPVAGFQFDMTGITITGASGGSAGYAGFSISTGNNTVLGFSFSGSTIPSGSSILAQVLFTDYNPPLCIASPTFSDESGGALSVLIGACYN